MAAFTPLRPDELMEDHFLESLRQFALIMRKRKDLQGGGGMLSMRVGQTREFKDYRAYAPKDDLRSIDWRLYARLEKLFVRLFEDQQQTQVHVYLDLSASMGIPYREKWLSAARMTLAMAYLSWQSHHRVSVHGFGTSLKTLVSGAGINEGFKKLVAAICQEVPTQQADFTRAFRHGVTKRGRRDFHVVISDFLVQDLGELNHGLQALRAWGGEVQLVQLLHPEERSGDLGGQFDLVEVETQQLHRMNPSPSIQRYRERFEAHQLYLQQITQRFGMGMHSADCTLKFEEVFRQFLLRSVNFRKAS